MEGRTYQIKRLYNFFYVLKTFSSFVGSKKQV